MSHKDLNSVNRASPKRGANYVQAGLWKAFANRDANLITGQQNFSHGETAKARHRNGRALA
jgi:putative intracellular protease/amidase